MRETVLNPRRFSEEIHTGFTAGSWKVVGESWADIFLPEVEKIIFHEAEKAARLGWNIRIIVMPTKKEDNGP